jgi:hypothetical protein
VHSGQWALYILIQTRRCILGGTLFSIYSFITMDHRVITVLHLPQILAQQCSASAGGRVVGVDISKNMVRICFD